MNLRVLVDYSIKYILIFTSSFFNSIETLFRKIMFYLQVSIYTVFLSTPNLIGRFVIYSCLSYISLAIFKPLLVKKIKFFSTNNNPSFSSFFIVTDTVALENFK